jgi:hypothetical protein
MVMAVAVSGVVGYLLLAALTLSIHDIRAVLDTKDAGGNSVPPVMVILIQALGGGAGTAFAALAAMAMWFCGLSAVTWSSRVIWAFARDEGLPLSSLWKRVSASAGHRRRPSGSRSRSRSWRRSTGAYAVVTSISTIGLLSRDVIRSACCGGCAELSRDPRAVACTSDVRPDQHARRLSG